jgi:hypothetical protein
MKRTMMIAAVIGMALLIAAPASALETKFSGELRMQGFSHDNVNLENDGSTDSYYRSRFRLKTVFEINDNISVTAQLDALDKYWGQDPYDGGRYVKPSLIGGSVIPGYYEDPSDRENIEWDTAYATIKTKVGGFLVGRQWNSQWGCFGIGDSTGPVDRILYVLPIENLTFIAYAQKYDEYDEDFVSSISDADNDKYAAMVRYQGEDIEAGLLATFYNFKQFPAMRDLIPLRNGIYHLNTGTPLGSLPPDELGAVVNASINGTPYANNARAYIVDPYFVGKFGGFTLKGELIYGWGDADFDPNKGKDLDVDVMTYLLEAGYETGPFAMRGGYWYMSGDDDPTDDKHESFAYIEPNRDLDIAFLLTGDNDHYTSDVTNFLGGGIGNFAGNSQNMACTSQYAGSLAMAGAKLFYLGFDYKPIDTVTVGLTWANAKADKPPGPDFYNVTQEWDDEVGDEFDFKVSWKPWPNLEYKFIAAYLDAGDFWKQGGTKQIDDLTTFYNALTISF